MNDGGRDCNRSLRLREHSTAARFSYKLAAPKEDIMAIAPAEPTPKDPPGIPSPAPDLPAPPIKEPGPDVLPDELPNPNPDENEDFPRKV